MAPFMLGWTRTLRRTTLTVPFVGLTVGTTSGADDFALSWVVLSCARVGWESKATAARTSKREAPRHQQRARCSSRRCIFGLTSQDTDSCGRMLGNVNQVSTNFNAYRRAQGPG